MTQWKRRRKVKEYQVSLPKVETMFLVAQHSKVLIASGSPIGTWPTDAVCPIVAGCLREGGIHER